MYNWKSSQCGNVCEFRKFKTFPTTYFCPTGKALFYLSTGFSDSQTFPQAKNLEMQIYELFDVCQYPLIQLFSDFVDVRKWLIVHEFTVISNV